MNLNRLEWLKQANIYHLCNFQLGVPKHPSKPIPAKSLFALHHTSGIIHHILHTILRSIKTWSPILGKGPASDSTWGGWHPKLWHVPGWINIPPAINAVWIICWEVCNLVSYSKWILESTSLMITSSMRYFRKGSCLCFNLVILGPSSLSTKLPIQKPIA